METTKALRLAGIERTMWDGLMGRGLYPVAPQTVQGLPRVFDSRDLVALVVLGQLIAREIRSSVAAEIACEVHRQLGKDRKITMLSAWKIKLRNSEPRIIVAEQAPRPNALELYRVDVTAIRLSIHEAISDEGLLRPTRAK